MTEDEALFNAIFENIGGIFDIHEAEKHVKHKPLQIIKDATQAFLENLRATHPKIPSINFNFIFNGTLNAAADFVEGKYYVGLNIGAYLLINDMFSKMMSTKEIFPLVGNINLETPEKKVLRRFIYQNDIFFNIHKQNENYPKDEIRKFFCVNLSINVLNYLIYHEIGHILRGHCGYYTSLRESYWSEFGDKSGLKYIDSQTMEMDADSFAVNIVYNKVLNILNSNTPNNPITYPYTLFYNDISTFFFNWIFSIYCFHRLCNFELFNHEEAMKSTHPEPTLRITLMIDNIFSLMIRSNLPNISTIGNKLIVAIKEAEEAFVAISNDDNHLDIFIKNSSLSDQASQEIRRNWNNVRPLIEKFAVHPELLPPLVTE
jgi:hypothetical protein